MAGVASVAPAFCVAGLDVCRDGNAQSTLGDAVRPAAPPRPRLIRNCPTCSGVSAIEVWLYQPVDSDHDCCTKESEAPGVDDITSNNRSRSVAPGITASTGWSNIVQEGIGGMNSWLAGIETESHLQHLKNQHPALSSSYAAIPQAAAKLQVQQAFRGSLRFPFPVVELSMPQIVGFPAQVAASR